MKRITLRTSILPMLLALLACGSGDSAPASPPGGEGGADGGPSALEGGPNPGDGAVPPGMDAATDVSPPAKPTASTWLGSNVSGDMPRVDIAYQLTPFDTPAASKDANGYPLAGQNGKSQTDIGFVLPTGTYKISFKGTGSLAVSGIGTLTGSFQPGGGEQRAAVNITGTPGSFGQLLTLAITNQPGQTVTDIHLYAPGFDYDATATFLPQFLGLLTPFRALRFMEWENINGSTLVNWADRPDAAHFGASLLGQPYEHIAELVNETGKDCWVNVPELASDDFVLQLATFLSKALDWNRIASARAAQGIATPFRLILENSNETWNTGFTAYKTFLAAANQNVARYPGTYAGTYGPSWMSQDSDLMKVGEYEADRLVKMATVFRQVFGAVGQAAVISPVLSGWALGAVYSDDGLLFIKANYGDPKAYVTYVATAPYFGPDDAQTGSLASLFTSADANIAAMGTTFDDFQKLVTQYGLLMAGYEGGQGIGGATNQSIKHLAQHDQRMYAAYNQYFALWKQHFGEALFMHFDLAGTAGLPENIYQYGYWGSIISTLEDPVACAPNLPMLTGTETVASVVHHCPKYRSLREQVP